MGGTNINLISAQCMYIVVAACAQSEVDQKNEAILLVRLIAYVVGVIYQYDTQQSYPELLKLDDPM